MKKTIFVLTLLFSGCAGMGGLGSLRKTIELQPGMTVEQVKQILGKPSQTEFIASKLIWKYHLHSYSAGLVPYYLIFDKNTQRLDSWYANEEEYYKNQELWLKTIPPTQKHEIKIKSE